MLQEWVILLVSLCYLGILFGIAYYADKRADAGRSIISNPYIYTLSIAIYCTAWTFYGSVGRAASNGVGFLPIYIGPTIMAATWWLVLRKIIRIAKTYRITSIADFIASRYGKSAAVSGLVTIIAVVGIIPYISLQLKAISISFNVMNYYPEMELISSQGTSIWNDTAFAVTMIMAAFSILFGTRNIDATERHEGMIAAIAFESIIKLLSFTAAGIFITFFMFDGPTHVFSSIDLNQPQPSLTELEIMPGGYTNWFSLTFLAMMAILFLPRQFQVLVVENVNENHVRKAAWLFPLYLLVINIFVLPIAMAGNQIFSGGNIDPDIFVLALPLAKGMKTLALFIYIGGLSASTGMVIVAAITLSTMVCNDLIMPILLRLEVLPKEDMSGTLLTIRRFSILIVLLLGYFYFRLVGESYTLASTGILSFAAAAQFAPAILLGIYWKGANRNGAISGLIAGFMVWAYTLLLPSLIKSSWLPMEYLTHGPFGITLLRPCQLFGIQLDPVSHSVFWSMLANCGMIAVVSMFSKQKSIEHIQASLFVNIYQHSDGARLWRGKAMAIDLKKLAARFIGLRHTREAFISYEHRHGIQLASHSQADANLVEFTERLLAGAIGSASARVMVSSVAGGTEISQEGVMRILDETTQVIEYSHQLEQKSQELEAASQKLQEANTRLKELDKMKDEFVSTISHELRTPLTSVRAFSEILHDNPQMKDDERKKFLSVIVKETERLTRLVNRILDLAKVESGRADWKMEDLDIAQVIQNAIDATSQLFRERQIKLNYEVAEKPLNVFIDQDRIIQVLINLLSNAVKFSQPETGKVEIKVEQLGNEVIIRIKDNGPGIKPGEQNRIFDKFMQINDLEDGKPEGTGLGLSICRRIIEYHNGRIWVESIAGTGATFIFTLPA